MRIYPLERTFYFLLITAFLAAQWSSVHYHLSQHHEHDGDHHQHSVSAHSHQYDSHHRDAIDSAIDHEEHKVVELDPDYNSPAKKKDAKDTDTDTPVLVFNIPHSSNETVNKYSFSLTPFLYFQFYSPSLPRGPPTYS